MARVDKSMVHILEGGMVANDLFIAAPQSTELATSETNISLHEGPFDATKLEVPLSTLPTFTLPPLLSSAGLLSAAGVLAPVEIAAQFPATTPFDGEVDSRINRTGPDGSLKLHFVQLAGKLAQNHRAMEVVCSALADNMRAPLRSIAGLAQIMENENQHASIASGKDCTARIATAAKQLDSLIEDLLQYGQLSYEAPVCDTISLETTVCSVVGELAAKSAGQQSEINVQRPLAQVRAHPQMLRKVFICLIDNALKFVLPGRIPQIRIWNEPSPTQVRVYVEDNGIGVAAEHHERIFDLFQRGNEAYPGNGAGLALVRRAVELMNGHTGVESKPGQGSRFWFELPSPS